MISITFLLKKYTVLNCRVVAGCDIARSCYAKYEAGELNIRASVIIELKKIYNCTYDDFFAGLDE